MPKIILHDLSGLRGPFPIYLDEDLCLQGQPGYKLIWVLQDVPKEHFFITSPTPEKFAFLEKEGWIIRTHISTNSAHC